MPDLQAAIVPVTPFQQNCTILFDQASRRAVVIDPGGDVPHVLGAIRELDVRPERILLPQERLRVVYAPCTAPVGVAAPRQSEVARWHLFGYLARTWLN